MLQIKGISKQYKTGDLIQQALNNVSLCFRDNEFVSILGQSGSGKTTMLNIVGGLDSYDNGDLIINGRSTKNYKDSDWDTYRNHTIGFVFQSYNLIPHQTVLSNVELALTISGISKNERKVRATEALTKVGLENHLHKRPNQMSGGQMQRVAIARALVNNPDILLADEPTGALDTQTSVQIMDLLREVAKDRLVIMVTHNPELAQEYSTRIINLKDGQVEGDSNPFVAATTPVVERNLSKAKMSFKTSFALSFNNLKTKKSRTLLTSFAGSIGIIGIALILSLSNGVNTYIENLQKDTMASYPISIQEESIDMSAMMNHDMYSEEDKNDTDAVYPNYDVLQMTNDISVTNNLSDFKAYLEDEKNGVDQYLGENGITYSYMLDFSVFSYDDENTLVNSNANATELLNSENLMYGMDSNNPMESMMMGGNSAKGASNFSELAKHDEEVVSPLLSGGYDVVAGAWPEAYNEVVLFVDRNNSISMDTLYQLGLMNEQEYKDIANQIERDEEVSEIVWDYDEVLNHELYMMSASRRFIENEQGVFTYLSEEDISLNSEFVTQSTPLKIVGVVKPNGETSSISSSTSVGYTTLLTDYVIEEASNSAVVQAQKATPEINVLTGFGFEATSDAQKAIDMKAYLSGLDTKSKASFYSLMMASSGAQTSPSMGQAPKSDESLAAMLDQWLLSDPDEELLVGIYDQYLGTTTYEKNLSEFGNISYEAPTTINIYTDTFENKEMISQVIEEYNEQATTDNQIIYTDFVAEMTASMTSMIDVISYVLIAFVAVSLVVSCIMIGIITHISVMERTKEIGVLRALGASKKNISQVFNAETIIIGLCSGTLGIVITILLNIPITNIVQNVLDDTSLVVTLPLSAGGVLIAISSIITVVGGLLPAKKAAKKDPVIALRTE